MHAERAEWRAELFNNFRRFLAGESWRILYENLLYICMRMVPTAGLPSAVSQPDSTPMYPVSIFAHHLACYL